MDRRGFLQGILTAMTAPAIVRIGSLMPVRSIVIPTTAEVIAVGGGNTLLTIDMITKEALRLLNANMAFMSRVNESYDADFYNGDTLRIRRPIKYG
jgi:phospholipid N-methyltransferase